MKKLFRKFYTTVLTWTKCLWSWCQKPHCCSKESSSDHLCWHPKNFGVDSTFLEKVITHNKSWFFIYNLAPCFFYLKVKSALKRMHFESVDWVKKNRCRRWRPFQKMICSIVSNHGQFLWSSVGIEEECIMKG